MNDTTKLQNPLPGVNSFLSPDLSYAGQITTAYANDGCENVSQHSSPAEIRLEPSKPLAPDCGRSPRSGSCGSGALPKTFPRPKPLMYSTKRKKWLTLKDSYAEKFRKAGDLVTAGKLDDCSETMSLVICGKCNHKWYVVTHCKLRCCPLCSFQVSRKRAEFLNKKCQKLKSVKLLTLTMPAWHGAPKIGKKYLQDCWTKLRRHKVMRSVKGGAYIIELLPHEDYWHIHLHTLLDCAYIPNQQLFTAWRGILGVRHAEIDIRQADSREARAYIAKEVTKNMAIALDPDMIVKWYEAIRGTRTWESFGSFRNKKMNDLDNEIEEPDFVPTCPNCGAHHSMYFARDGPFIWGGEQWSHVEHMVTGGWPEKIKAEICYVKE